MKVIDKKVRLENLGLYWDWDVDAQVDTASFLRVQECMEVPFLHNAVPTALQCFLPRHFLLKPVSLSLQLHIDLRRAEQRPSLHRRCPPSHCKRVAVVLCQPTADQHTPPCVLVDYENGGCPSQPGRRMAPLLCILQRADAGRLYTAPVPGVLRGGVDRAAHSSAGGGGGRGHERLLGAREPPAVLRLPGLRDLAEPADAAGQVPAVQAARGLRERARVVAVRGARGGVQQPAAPAAARVEALPAVQAAARGVHRAVQAARAGRRRWRGCASWRTSWRWRTFCCSGAWR